MIAAFHTLLRFHETPTARLAAATGALAGAAVLFHESAGLFGIVERSEYFRRRLVRRRRLTAYASALDCRRLHTLPAGRRVRAAFHFLGRVSGWAGAYAERGWWWDFHILHNLRLDYLPCAMHFRGTAGTGGAGTDAFARIRLGRSHSCVGIIWQRTGRTARGGCAPSPALPCLLRSPERSLTQTCLLWVGVYALFSRSGVPARSSSGFRRWFRWAHCCCCRSGPLTPILERRNSYPGSPEAHHPSLGGSRVQLRQGQPFLWQD